MKSERLVNLEPVQENDLKQLLNETKETLAIQDQQEIVYGRDKQFSAADMWNLHKKQRFSTDMRRRLN